MDNNITRIFEQADKERIIHRKYLYSFITLITAFVIFKYMTISVVYRYKKIYGLIKAKIW